ncbi:SUV3 family DEAD/DEAH box RNA helicase [Stutzerimonas stutzeri]|jgi:ATP-dependent RNA helicase SUPV3L1/SUV3|uniref:SUV3 family DEAD/DEAH box RNA helicase n=1 Tax=Stutzerimonas stutzeri TaxID=316 RepID=UPI000F776376|nr:DEAD/DEAH box helicase [Stutzerimonas stutzeri]MBA4691137.1 RNA helicase [Pseudomonas sp.]MBW8456547.1 RNA helicase [Pseudomonas sp.]MCP3433091.1 DEAD/DEAH box helicase [Stutzerimonas stutzeri]RRV61138.1 RNA helicase [Stutzerimonas stutzeri]RTM24953.1 RNA helicase [Stutzerimonas stutzeri]
MAKAGGKQFKSIRLERLARFIEWATARYPDFVAKKHHQEKWFAPYIGYPMPGLGRAAKAFWLGLHGPAVDQLMAEPATDELLERIVSRDLGEIPCSIDVYGSQKTFTLGSPAHLLEPEWALRLADSPQRDDFPGNLQAAVQQYVRGRLQLLERPFAEMDEEDRQRCLARIRPELSRLDEFLQHAVATVNEIRHDLRYLVTLHHGPLELELQRRIPADQDHLLSAAEVETWQRQDRADLQASFERMLELADGFDLQQLGHKRLTELIALEPGRMRKAIRAARREHEERMAFAVLLENNPRFVHYHKLYPARRLTRRWIALLGPTNSGKTHRSIEAMAAAEHAIYLSPLRLMALENQERIESMGVPCSLVTGEEEIIREGATHFCCTVEEFARFRHQHWDVVVVDEVQMMADPQRGWAWVDALVSAHTPKLMMTGPALIEPSLRTLCELCEDQLQVQRTKRLSPVEVAKHATTLERLEPGSLLVAFSRKLVLELKGMLESAGKSVSVVYGALSPEVRREQARRFREGEADIMVATDAVGMGLNLPAHTLCFYTDEKFDGIQNRQLKVQEVKQIGGRAGRFGHHDSGEITALDPQTLKSIRRLFNSPDAPVDLSQFQVRPSIDHLSAISELMGEPSLLRSWLTFNRNINYGEAFVSVLPDELAEWIELIDDPKIPLWLRWTFACTPIRGGFDSPASQHAQRWIKRVAEGHAIPMPRLLLGADLASLESTLHVVETYLHLARSLPEHFPEHDDGEEARKLLNDAITRELSRQRKPRAAKRGGGRKAGRRR